jgi:hypothetical protein
VLASLAASRARARRPSPPRSSTAKMPRSSLLLALVAALAPACQAKVHLPKPPPAPKPFSTSITGEGGPPIRDTPVGTPGTSTMFMHSLMTVDPLAVCNDGSPAAYYLAEGSGTGAFHWLVYLEGSVRARSHLQRAACGLQRPERPQPQTPSMHA